MNLSSTLSECPSGSIPPLHPAPYYNERSPSTPTEAGTSESSLAYNRPPLDAPVSSNAPDLSAFDSFLGKGELGGDGDSVSPQGGPSELSNTANGEGDPDCEEPPVLDPHINRASPQEYAIPRTDDPFGTKDDPINVDGLYVSVCLSARLRHWLMFSIAVPSKVRSHLHHYPGKE